MSLKIIEEGLYTTIQDLGRKMRSYGFSATGPMDKNAMRLANLIVGNDENDAVIEMSLIGPTIQFNRDALIAVTGADMSVNMDKISLESYRPIWIKKGSVVQFRPSKKGVYGYMAVRGGLQSPKILGSRSTVMRADIEGIAGRPLMNGDEIALEPLDLANHRKNWYVPTSFYDYVGSHSQVIHYIKGPQFDWFHSDSFSKQKWKISTQSNRIGYRLQGEPVEMKHKEDLLTEATAFGTIQIPPNGQPIVLMADAQPTGGYPKIGQVIKVDLPKLSQLALTGTVQFKEVSIDEAYRLLREQERHFHILKYFIEDKYKKDRGR